MAELRIVNPVQLQLHGVQDKYGELQTALTYVDRKVDFQIAKLKKNIWFRRRDPEGYQERMDKLKATRKQTLLNGLQLENCVGSGPEPCLWTWTGLKDRLEKKLGVKATSMVYYPEPEPLAWHYKPRFEPYPYQIEAKEKLLQVRHGGVEICTGGGKTFIILHLVKELGLKTLVMAPSVSIAEQIRDLFIEHLGRNKVGQFFDGKKETRKLITVGIPQSLTRIEPGSQESRNLMQCQVFVADESHLCPAQTLAEICFGLMETAPYRFFFSGTQIRNDGLDLLLESIIGPIVHRMTVREGVDGGFLARPHFRLINTVSMSPFRSDDANDMTRHHLFYNPRVVEQAARIANGSIEAYGHPVLILIDEVEQFTKLLPHFRYRAGFAHGPLGENRDKVPGEYHQSDPNALVREFNSLRLPILVGTSCISIGTDVQSVKTMINLRGGKSEIEVRQGVGRCTRLHPSSGKNACSIYDFDVTNVPVLHRHSEGRRAVYQEIYGPVQEVDWRT